MFAMLMMLCLNNSAFAQDRGGHGPEPVRHEVHAPAPEARPAPARVESRDAMKDYERLTGAIRAWKSAIASRDRSTERWADGQIQAWIQNELSENRYEGRGQDRGSNARLRQIAGALRDDQWKFSGRGGVSRWDYSVKSERLEELQRLAKAEVYEARSDFGGSDNRGGGDNHGGYGGPGRGR